MGLPFIVLGDKTDHGGTVMSAAPTSITGGKPIARVGDKVPCPRCGNPNAVIVGPGDPTMIVDGAPVALHGDKTSCGATLISSQMPTIAGGPGGKTAAAQSAEPAPADLALQSDAESFDDLPPKAKIYVLEQAYRTGVISDSELLTVVDPDKYTVDTYDNGMRHFRTSDKTAANRLVRQQLNIRPFQPLPKNRILNTDQDDPQLRSGGYGVHYKHIAQVDLRGGSWAARFADSRPVEGVGNLSDAPSSSPEVSASNQGAGAMGTGAQLLSGVTGKGVKAYRDGVQERAEVYENPDGVRVVHIEKISINQRTSEPVSTSLTQEEAANQLNSTAASGLDDATQQAEAKDLNDFYLTHFGH